MKLCNAISIKKYDLYGKSGDISVKLYYIASCTFCNIYKVKYPVSGAISIQFYPKHLNVNLASFY